MNIKNGRPWQAERPKTSPQKRHEFCAESSISAELRQLWRELASGQALKLERAYPGHIRGRFECFPRYARTWDQLQAHISQARFECLNQPTETFAMADESNATKGRERADLIERFRIPFIWKELGVAGEPSANCSSPFRDDVHPSFSVFEDGKAFNDFATGEGGNVFRFFGLATGHGALDEYRAFKDFLRTRGYQIDSDEMPLSDEGSNNKFPPQWQACIDTVTEEYLNDLSSFRGYPLEDCRRIVQAGLIGKCDGAWAFPVFDAQGQFVSVHKLISRQNKAWKYEPTGQGAWPMIRGELTSAQKVFILESSWDWLTFLLLTNSVDAKPPHPVICTRGAKTFAQLKKIWPASIDVIAISQNDEAGQDWLERVRKLGVRTLRIVKVPESLHDLNDWLRANLTPDQLREAIEHASFIGKEGKQSVQQGERTEESEDFSWLTFESIDELPEKEPVRIIEGVLHIGEKLGITAASKGFKTWLLLYLGYCIVNGLPFLGFETRKSKVVIFDLELTRRGVRRRLEYIRNELGDKGEFANLKVCCLRGKARRFCGNLKAVVEQMREQGFEVVIIDPVYKFLLGKEENSNGVVANVLEELTEFCAELGVALVYVHHHSKGNQAGKDSLDRGAGAGAWARDPDALLDLTEHDDSTEDEKVFTAQITVREFPPIAKFVVRWKFPLLVRDELGLDPEKLKRPKKFGAQTKYSERDVMEQLGTDELRTGELCTRCREETGMSERTFYDLWKSLRNLRYVVSTPEKNWKRGPDVRL